MKIVIGSRGSDLALWQANFVQSQLAGIGVEATIKIIKTQGDQIQHLSFDKLEGKGFFTKEIEEALLANEIDLAVHSHKDLPTTSPAGLIIAAVSEREDPSELLLINKEAVDFTQKFNLKFKAVVGTSSSRRKSQLLSFREDVILEELRGNVPTRIQKLRDKKYDAIMLAAAGVERLNINLDEFQVEKLSPVEFVPAPAQGVLALQIRDSDTELFELLQKINSSEVQKTIAVERKILNLFDGGCQLPLGVYCKKSGVDYYLWAAKAKSWNTFPVRVAYKLNEEEILAKDDIAKKVIDKITSLKPCKVFITRDLDEQGYFYNALKSQGYEVTGKSLISTSTVRFSTIPKSDWIFFSSRNSVKYFFEQQPEIDEAVKYGVVGKGTESILKAFGKIASFVGDKTDVQEIGQDFSKVVNDGSVLFPQAIDSLQSIQRQLSFSNKVYDLYTYRTDLKEDFEVPDSDTFVFTSPSNVEAFFKKHTLPSKAKVISIGPSTSMSLDRQGIKNHIKPFSFDELGLAEAVFSI